MILCYLAQAIIPTTGHCERCVVQEADLQIPYYTVKTNFLLLINCLLSLFIEAEEEFWKKLKSDLGSISLSLYTSKIGALESYEEEKKEQVIQVGFQLAFHFPQGS